ncbi:MAG TPA: aldo/keto reductase [Terriglobales bacterium]|nr:aldo/keto reductase [Terriglobales bacterium]
MSISGFATSEGTLRYRNRFPQLRDAGHFRRQEHVPGIGDLWLSSIGLGTYLGEPTPAADAAYTDAIGTALRSGINVLDTAINYRHQRSERSIGSALQELIGSSELSRDEVLVCTKAGFLSFDADMPADVRGYFMSEYVKPGILDPAQVAAGSHCLSPRYLADQIDRSRRNLGLDTIDVFYVHNPESQLSEVSRALFRDRLRDAFVMLEEAVAASKIRFYGVATWNAFRVLEGESDYVGLAEVLEIARAAGGDAHHLRVIQLPFNLGMTDAFGLSNHQLIGTKMSAMKVAAAEGVAVMGSATLYQGRLTRDLPGVVSKTLGMSTDAENAIQFARSAPGITTSLIGMGRKEHVLANLKPAFSPPTPPDKWAKLFTGE